MTSLTEIPGREALTTEVVAWPRKASATVVVDAESYRAASEMLLGIKALRARLNDLLDPHIASANRLHKDLCAEKRRHEQPLEEAERTIKNALVKYDDEQERRRREEQRRLEAEARRQAETDAIARAAALEREGREYGDAGFVQEAEQIVEEAIQAPPPPVPLPVKATPRVAGITYRETWSATVTDKLALVKYVAAHPQYLHLLDANQTALNQLARSLKSGLQMPGVRAVPTKDVAAGGR